MPQSRSACMYARPTASGSLRPIHLAPLLLQLLGHLQQFGRERISRPDGPPSGCPVLDAPASVLPASSLPGEEGRDAGASGPGPSEAEGTLHPHAGAWGRAGAAPPISSRRSSVGMPCLGRSRVRLACLRSARRRGRDAGASRTVRPHARAWGREKHSLPTADSLFPSYPQHLTPDTRHLSSSAAHSVQLILQPCFSNSSTTFSDSPARPDMVTVFPKAHLHRDLRASCRGSPACQSLGRVRE